MKPGLIKRIEALELSNTGTVKSYLEALTKLNIAYQSEIEAVNNQTFSPDYFAYDDELTAEQETKRAEVNREFNIYEPAEW